MIRLMRKHFWLLMGAMLLVSGCGKEDGFIPTDPAPQPQPDPTPLPAPEQGDRTVLVYIVADKNGLETTPPRDFASQDIAEMLEGIKAVNTSRSTLLAYVDDADEPALYRIAKDAQGNVIQELVKAYEEQASTDPVVMSGVLENAFGAYPAESYGLVYWSHADGWIPYPVPKASTRWIGQDKGAGDSRMNLSDFAAVLADAPHLDFLMFDACFMLSVEVAYELRDYVDYYIGSPTENPGPGAPYDKIVPLMFKENAVNEMAEAYFEAYEQIYADGAGISNANWTGGTSIGVICVAALEKLASATRLVMEESAGSDADELRAEVFDYDKRTSSSHVGYYDMQELIRKMPANQAVLDSWQAVYEEALGYWNTTPLNYSQFSGMFSMERANGITHYIPSLTKAYPAAEAYRSTAWYEDAGLSFIGW